MLELKSISWKNFLSYGDYVTTLELDKLGKCLITGEVTDSLQVNDNPSSIRKSNGAGKSTIPNVIQWVLFGRTMHSRNPGNNIVNWFTGKDCWAKLTFKNGDTITRTRNTEGKNELIYSKDGDEISFISDTLSTATLQQQQLNKTFGLDWEVFCGSVFFNQYGKPWMEMADATRKKAIERILHVDRFVYYAQCCKSKCDNLDKLVEKINTKIETQNAEISRLENELNRVRTASDNFAENRKNRRKELEETLKEEENKLSSFELPEIAKLEAKWNVVDKIKDKINSLRRDKIVLNSESTETKSTIDSLKSKINSWKLKSGKMCASCEQSVAADHISAKIDPYEKNLNEALLEYEQQLLKLSKLNQTIKDAEQLLESRMPSMSLIEAKSVIDRYNIIKKNIERLKSTIEKIESEANPHSDTISEIEQKITDTKTDIGKLQEEYQRSELLNRHYHYVYKAYNDRTKIKSFIFRDHIPFINQRLKHYLDIFELDIKIELTEGLGITSNMWGYDFESGGERKRTDVAFMLAMFDFHEQMYGRQCNILVLDEVDGRLDDDGIDALIKIITTDLAHRVETILIISHRNMMFDTFPMELKVIRNDRYSRLEAIA